MKRLHLLWLALMAIFAVSATASAVANAELAILPAPSVANPLNFTFKSAGAMTFETVSGKKFTCTSLSGKGAFESERLGKIEFKLVGCAGPLTVKCTGLSDTTLGNITFTGEVHIRHLLPPTAGVALVILPGHIHLTCAGILFLELGCFASMDVLTVKNGESAVEKLRDNVDASFLQTSGKQSPLEIMNDASTADESCMLTMQEETKAPEEMGQGWEATFEKFEQGSVEKTILIMLK